MFIKIISLLLSITAFILSTCGINVNLPVYQPPKQVYFHYLKDVSYGEDKQQTVDLFYPTDSKGGETSLFFYIHGGAWIAGEKGTGLEHVKKKAKKYHIASATIDYRLLVEGSHEYDCNTLMSDIYDAMSAIKNTLAKEGVFVKSCVVSGDSAGAHMALLYSYLHKNDSPIKIGLVHSNCGPTDTLDPNFSAEGMTYDKGWMYMLNGLLIGEDITDQNFTSPEIQEKIWSICPCKYVANDVPPTIFNSCGQDVFVPVSNAVKLCELLKKTTVDFYYDNFDNSGHCGKDDKDIEKTKKFDEMFDKMMKKYVL